MIRNPLSVIKSSMINKQKLENLVRRNLRLQNEKETKKWYPATAKMFLGTRHRGVTNAHLLILAFALRSSMIT